MRQSETRRRTQRAAATEVHRWAPVFFAVLALGAVTATGQEPAEELVTDRPDQTESAEVVPPGRVQVEVGWLLTREDERGVRTETVEVPGTLVRTGLLPGLELRLGWGGWTEEEERHRAGASRIDGAADLEVGVKARLWEERGRRPQAALLASVAVPTGAEELTSDRWDPAVRLSLAHTLSETLSLGYNLGLARESDAGEDGRRETTTLALYTAALGIGLSDRAGAFVEAFGELPVEGGGGPRHSLDGGLTFLLRPNLQLDAAVGAGLSRQAPDWFVGLGLSVRLPR